MEEITITGATLRRLMQQSARFGIENYQRLEEQCVKVRLLIVQRHVTLVIRSRTTSLTDWRQSVVHRYLIEPKKELELP